MDQDLRDKLQRELKKSRRRVIWKRIVSVLACIVVFCTTYVLILPAITLSNKTYCGYEEHEHGDSCYEDVLICEMDEGATHTHGDECYELSEKLICSLEETDGHTHVEGCYTSSVNLTCSLEETAGHIHTDGCKGEDGEIVCGLEEAEGHSHSDSCYTSLSSLSCGQEEQAAHQHGEECWQTEKSMICSKDEQAGHEHKEDCYEQKLQCEIKEHQHELICSSNPEADVETASEWEKTLPDKEKMSGEWKEDALLIADSQEGYQESDANYIVIDGKKKGYTRYGDWYGSPYGDWCAMFVSFCLDYAEIENFPLDCNCQHWIETLSKEEYQLYHKADKYTPEPGDLIFFDWDSNSSESERRSEHIGFVAEIIPETEDEPAKIKTIEGNSSDCVKYNTYEMNDSTILGYGEVPKNPELQEEEPDMTPAPETEEAPEEQIVKEAKLEAILLETKDESQGVELRWKIEMYASSDQSQEYLLTDKLSSDGDVETVLHYLQNPEFEITGIKADGEQETLLPEHYTITYYDSSNNICTLNNKPVQFRIDFTDIMKTYEQIVILYSSYAECDMQPGDTIICNNEANIKNGPEVALSHSYTKDIKLEKYGGTWDGISYNNEVGGNGYSPYKAVYSKEDMVLGAREAGDYLYYLIRMNPDDEMTEPIVVEDTLPENTSLAVNGEMKPFLAYFEKGKDLSIAVKDAGISNEGKRCYLADCLTYKVDGQTVTFTLDFPDVIKKYLAENNAELALCYALEFDNTLEGVYTNTVKWNDVTDLQKQEIYKEYEPLKKYGEHIVDVNGEKSEVVHYSLMINLEGKDLIEDVDTLTLVDTMSCETSAVDGIRFDSESLKVYAYNKATEQKGELLADGTYSYIYDTEAKKLTVYIPDEAACVVEYDYTISSMTAESVSLNNKALLQEITGAEDNHEIEFTTQGTPTDVSSNKIVVKKVDAQNHNTLLEGAVFDLYKVGEEEAIEEALTTNVDGEVEINCAVIAEDAGGSLYMLKETAAPDGYCISEENTYFYLLKEGESAEEAKASVDVENVIFLNNGGGTIVIPNESVQLSAEKVWTAEDGSAVTEHPETVTLNLMRIEENSSELIDSVVLSNNPRETTTIEVDGKTVFRTTGDWKVDWSELPETSEDGTKAYVYYVEEIDVPEGWIVGYNGNHVVSGRIVVTNKKASGNDYVIPKTGGPGTNLYTAGGILLMMGSVLLYMKRRKQIFFRED